MRHQTHNGDPRVDPRFRSRTPWREKLDRPQQPKVVNIPPRMQPRCGRGTMLIPTPRLIDELMRKAPRGKLITIGWMRHQLSERFGADTCCPLTTGIFWRIAAEAAAEELDQGKRPVTPYWRVVRDDGSLMQKIPGGLEAQARQLRAEGHVIERPSAKRLPRVKDFERRLLS